VSPSTNTLTASYSSSPLNGYIDELKFYDHALSAQQLRLLVTGVAANDVPSATIGTRSSQRCVFYLAPSLCDTRLVRTCNQCPESRAVLAD
jgi:hypothetical protein